MLINLRNALMSGKRLPYDAEVEYLKFPSGSYIDTGVIPNSSIVVNADTQFDNDAPTISTIFAANDLGFVLRKISSTEISISGGAWWSTVTSTPFDRHLYTMGWGYLDIDSVRKTSRTFGGSQDATLTIGYRRTQPTQSGGLIVYRFKIEVSGVLVRDYIPVRKGTVGCLYDRVSGALFGNAGTGDFVIGPDTSAPTT